MTDNNGDSAGDALAAASGKSGTGSDSGADTRAAWAIAKPERRDYAIVVTELNCARLVSEGGIFDLGPHVPMTHMGYFKPLTMNSSTNFAPETGGRTRSGSI